MVIGIITVAADKENPGLFRPVLCVLWMCDVSVSVSVCVIYMVVRTLCAFVCVMCLCLCVLCAWCVCVIVACLTSTHTIDIRDNLEHDLSLLGPSSSAEKFVSIGNAVAAVAAAAANNSFCGVGVAFNGSFDCAVW